MIAANEKELSSKDEKIKDLELVHATFAPGCSLKVALSRECILELSTGDCEAAQGDGLFQDLVQPILGQI